MSHFNVVTVKDKAIHEVSLEDINKIASLAATLKPKPLPIKVLGYYYALTEYMEKYPFIEFYDSYKYLINDINGRCILLSAMELSIMEYEHRQSNITPQTMDLYNAKRLQFQDVLDYNNKIYKKKARKAKNM